MSTRSRKYRLEDGDRVAVVGAGPAGSFFAGFLLHGAARRGLHLEVTVYDGKDFEVKGPRGCNMCAGVISSSLLESLGSAGIEIPHARVQAEVGGYRCILQDREYTLGPPDARRRILAVFRGNGPKFSNHTENVSFDEVILEHAIAAGARFVPNKVTDIELGATPEQPLVVHHGSKGEEHRDEADVVVVAVGVNTRLVSALEQAGFGYRAPRTVRTCQAEIPLGRDEVQRRLGGNIVILFLGIPGVRFGALTPKGEFVTLTLVGDRDLDRDDLTQFLDHPRVQDVLGRHVDTDGICTCFPRLPHTASRRPYTDRLVVIGDAAVSRHYKNGIASAFMTARTAAETILEHGYSRRMLRRHYGAFVRTVSRDNLAGRFFYWLNDRIIDTPIMAETQLRVVLEHPDRRVRIRMHRVLWSLFTGNEPYTHTLRRLVTPALQWRLFLTTQGVLAERAAYRFRTRSSRQRRRSISGAYGPLQSGQRVIILGGGPAGASCAIALKKQAASLGRDIEVVMYEPKDFESQTHYNQCAGVLSPPIQSLLEEELEVPFPRHLVQKQIAGYILHGRSESIELEGEGDDTVALRRISFDRYLYLQAVARGVQVVKSRVTGVELYPDRVLVYSDSDNRSADVVVGAFGLDEGMCRVFERATPYRHPPCLESIVTKLHPGEAFMEAFGRWIHAFLPALEGVDFGAVTPKGNHLTINIAGKTVNAHDMDRFLALPEVRVLFPGGQPPRGLHYFKGKFPNGPARNLYGNRYIVIGDAAGLLRPFKGKGVTAACQNGIVAAETIMHRGISRHALAEFVLRMQDVTRDLTYGKVVRLAALATARLGLLDPLLSLANAEKGLREALFYSVSGLKSFRGIVWEHFSPGLLARIAMAMAAFKLRGSKSDRSS